MCLTYELKYLFCYYSVKSRLQVLFIVVIMSATTYPATPMGNTRELSLKRSEECKYHKLELFVDIRSSIFPYSWHTFLFSFFQDSIIPEKGHLSDQHLITISERIRHFMQREFISSCGRYHMQDGQMAQYTELCDYSREGHKKLREINEKFNQICN
jgi:hypothetical protein